MNTSKGRKKNRQKKAKINSYKEHNYSEKNNKIIGKKSEDSVE